MSLLGIDVNVTVSKMLAVGFIVSLIAGCIALVMAPLGLEVAAQEVDDLITAFDFSAAVGRYATAHQADWSVRIWDAADDRLLHTIQIPDSRDATSTVASIDHVVFSPEGDRLAVSAWGDIPGLILVVDSFTGEILLEITEMPPVTAIEWSPDRAYLAGLYDFSPLIEPESFGSLDHFVALWDVETGQQLKQAICGVSPRSLAWVPSGDRVIFPDSARGIVVWDVAAWQEVNLLPVEYAVAVAWSPKAGNGFASIGSDGVVRIWDGATGSVLREISAGSIDEWPQQVFWSQDGEWIGITSENSLQIWNADTGTLAFADEAASQIQGSAFLADGSLILASGNMVQRLETILPIATPVASS